MQRCYKCKEVKPFDAFCKDKQRKNGKSARCKECFKQYHHKNLDKFRCYSSRWVSANKEKAYAGNAASKKRYPERVRNNKKDYERRKRHKDPIYRLRGNLRSRLKMALHRNHKTGSAIRDLGCSIEELRVYLAAKFQEGMTWDNYGKWHIDHIVPLAAFDLQDSEQFQKAVHFSNLQPLWAADNIRKGAYSVP